MGAALRRQKRPFHDTPGLFFYFFFLLAGCRACLAMLLNVQNYSLSRMMPMPRPDETGLVLTLELDMTTFRIVAYELSLCYFSGGRQTTK